MSTRVLLATLALAWTGPALAQDGDTPASQDLRAQASFRAATAYYEAGDYENALRDFQTSYDLSHRPELLWNLYLCHERVGQWEQAAGALESFITAGAPGFTTAQVQARLENLRERIARRRVGEADGAILAEEPDPLALPTARTDTTPVLAIVGFSVAGLGLVGFATFGSLTLVEDGALTAECATHCTAARASALDTYALVSDISAGLWVVPTNEELIVARQSQAMLAGQSQ